MAQRSCCVPGCSMKLGRGLPLHRFPNPNNPAQIERFRTWVMKIGGDIIGEDNGFIHMNRKVCHKHFEDVYRFPNMKLTALAIPTLEIPGVHVGEHRHIELPSTPTQMATVSTRPIPMDTDLSSRPGMHAVLHGFPNPEKDRIQFNTWLYSIGSDILGLENAHIFKFRRVCRKHFQHKYLCRNNRISNIAVPTLYLPEASTPVSSTGTVDPPSNSPSVLSDFLTCYKMACVKCNRSILSDENHYLASDLGPEILFIIEQDMGHEIATDAELCETCFNSVANLKSTHTSTEVIQDSTIESVSGTNECVWCLVPLLTRRTQYLTSGPQRDAISNIIAPRQVPDGGLVCHRCWTCASRLVGASASNSGQSQNICVWCRVSLSRRRTHIISHGPERDEITAQIAPRQILPGDRVCYACWVSARRNVQRATNPHLNNRNVCIVCSTSIVQRRTHLLLNGPVRDVISRRIHPRQITNHPLVCDDCLTWAQDAVHQVNGEPDQEEPEQVLDMPHSIQLNSYKNIVSAPETSTATDSTIDITQTPNSSGVENTDICDDGGDAGDDSDTLVESNVCRVCLAMDVKMYDLNDIELREMFQNITGIAVTENNHPILERLCWQCAARLKTAAAFRKQALLSDALLQGLAKTGEQIRKNDITLIKDSEDYRKTAATLTVVEAFHTVDIDAENDNIPPLSEKNDTKIVKKTVRKDFLNKKNESIIEENNDQTDVEHESVIEAPINTEMEYDQFDHICLKTGKESSNVFLDRNPLFNSNIPFKEDIINSAISSPPPSCSHVTTKNPILGNALKTPDDCEDKIKKHVIKIIKRDSISKILSKELISAKTKKINLKIGGISKNTSNLKLLKNTEVKANIPTGEESLNLENFEF